MQLYYVTFFVCVNAAYVLNKKKQFAMEKVYTGCFKMHYRNGHAPRYENFVTIIRFIFRILSRYGF